ncbi:carboxypeptidase regulatory-like domain-containing protein [candidate division KSB1 bacterium]|nr:carboxypeptidase regulatory-like domain-containing protein [candidate division KSB1 bacterium]
MKFLKVTFIGLAMILVMFSMSLFAQNMSSGSITGVVKSEADSIPVVKAHVFAFKSENIMLPKRYHALTNVDGSFTLKSLPVGQYRVFVQADSFVAEFYQDTQNPFLAKSITLGSDATVKLDDVYLKVGGVISGRVVDADKIGVPNVFVAAAPFDAFPQPVWLDSLMIWGGAYTDADGYYKMSTLDSGSYRVAAKIVSQQFPFFQIKYFDDKDNFNDADPVVVDNGAKVSDINFQFDFSQPTGGISGKITDANGSPLKGIYVFAWKASGADSFYSNFRGFRDLIATDENGFYEIKHLTPGEYIVSATRSEMWNFQTMYYDNVYKYEDATPVPVADIIVTGINFKFGEPAGLGSITGKVVTDGDQSPVANAFVEAMWMGTFVGQGKMMFKPNMFAWTNEKGEYTIDDLRAGTYIVLVHKNGYTEFYNDKQDIEKADQVEVKENEALTGIDFSIPATPDTGSNVTGMIKDESTGNPIEGAIVTLFPVMDSPQGTAFQGKFTLFDFFATVSDAKGEYMIAGVPAGKYIAVCWAQGYIVEFFNDKTTPWDADRIELDGIADKAGVDFAMIPGWGFKSPDPMAFGVISGQVTDTEGRYVDGAYISILDENYKVQASEKTGPDGSYTLGGVPAGKYFIKVDRMPYSTAYYGNGTSAENSIPVFVGDSGNFTITGVDVKLTPMSATSVDEEITGTGVPMEFDLSQNYPNPFNPSTTIRYALPTASHVTLKVFNLRGELVKTLVDGNRAANRYQVVWNGENESGAKVAAGIYLYQLKTDNHSQIKRMIFIK